MGRRNGGARDVRREAEDRVRMLAHVHERNFDGVRRRCEKSTGWTKRTG